ncbi:hypothetical protein SCUCBS95973_003987 [Sporothrix curviconia]|uniref:Ribosomal protein bL31m N-terminal domain-containing protein n=1 Tax=Sporothrix curviconia TaxID=1260050 RepID=A0ABP0BJY1_9PEZI
MAFIMRGRRLCASAQSVLFSGLRSQDSTISSAVRPRAPLPERLQMPSGCRNLSTTTALQARLIQRPKRPYQFTQLVQLSDGSTFTVRTTNPHPLHRCNKDTRNHIIWQPSEKSLRNVEVDEAGRLAAFRSRFGRGWDSTADPENDVAKEAQTGAGEQATGSSASTASTGSTDTLADLLSGYAAKEEPLKRGGLSAKEQAKKDKRKK